MDIEEPDFLIALTHTVTPESRLIELNWCAYDIKNQSAGEETHMFISPSGEELEDIFSSGDITKETGVTIEDMENCVDLPAVMQHFNKVLYENIILQNANFGLVTVSEDLLSQVLPDECTRLGLKLAPHFLKHYYLPTEFQKCYSDGGEVYSVQEMLSYLNLRESQERIKAHEECKGVIRVVNRMTKDGYKFGGAQDITAEKKPKTPSRKESVASPPPIVELPSFSKCLLLKGASHKTEETEIEDFFYGLKVEKVVKLLNLYGMNIGFFIVKFTSEEDSLEGLTYDQRRLNEMQVELQSISEQAFKVALENKYLPSNERLCILKTTEIDFNTIPQPTILYPFEDSLYLIYPESQVPTQLQGLQVDEQELNSNFKKVGVPALPPLTIDQKTRAVKLRGFYPHVAKTQIQEFLRDFEIFRKNIIIRQDTLDKTTGEVIVVLNTPEEKERLLKTQNNKLLENRLIEVYPFS